MSVYVQSGSGSLSWSAPRLHLPAGFLGHLPPRCQAVPVLPPHYVLASFSSVSLSAFPKLLRRFRGSLSCTAVPRAAVSLSCWAAVPLCSHRTLVLQGRCGPHVCLHPHLFHLETSLSVRQGCFVHLLEMRRWSFCTHLCFFWCFCFLCGILRFRLSLRKNIS